MRSFEVFVVVAFYKECVGSTYQECDVVLSASLFDST